jgi:hypothetical protein
MSREAIDVRLQGHGLKRLSSIPASVREPFDAFGSIFSSQLAGIRKLYAQCRDMEIHTDFIDSGRCNARVMLVESAGFVGFNKGFVLLPYDLFSRLLSHPMVLRNFGDAARERIGPGHREGLPRDFDALEVDRSRAGRASLPFRPQCPRRQKLADTMTTLVWRFIALHELTRQKVAEKTRQQLQRAGLPSIGHLRVEAFKKYARDHGWPEDLQVREVQILNAMWDRGPMTRREIAAAIGMPWKGTRKSLMGNRIGGSYLATLMRRGMVVNLGRIVKHPDAGKGGRAGQGKNCCVYSLSPTVQRRATPALQTNEVKHAQLAETRGQQTTGRAGPCGGSLATGAVAAVA